MIEELERLVDDIMGSSVPLVLLIGLPGSGKTGLLAQLAERRNRTVLNVGESLGRQLLTVPSTHRQVQAAGLLDELADGAADRGLLLLDNIELLFDRTLQLDPLSLLKRLSRTRKVVAVWPGDLRDGRLSYAEPEHPEHQDYGTDGLFPFKVN